MGLAYDPGPSASRTARRCIRRVAGRTAEACLNHKFVRVHSGTLAQAGVPYSASAKRAMAFY
jgi:hypothetical protein